MTQRRTLKKRLLRRMCLTESWVIFFILGIIMMNYPFITIFNKPFLIFDIPLLFLYFSIGWLVSILVIYFFTRAIGFCENDRKQRGDQL
ncbi:hypothetical protein [Geobacter sp. DSM 9736]|uniref:hypothetical protein n=1 Tax=Geobacter sp. DSM 9736 TaxID=1277350 RepID=UPI000B4FF01C|nr:hypothetical protein [Geobacter sp. DSM 9736]SNB46089.1 hypothetical protein SAMN06269301_1529 [Geobacter sp. DSM 9736]